jgi:hypothetical protein
MKIRVISSQEEIETIENEEIVHITFRPANKDILNLVQKCPNLKALHVSNSHNKTISRLSIMLLKMHNILLLEGDVWGHRKDIHEYYEIDPSIFDMIDKLKKEGKSKDDIVDMLKIRTRLSKDLITYLL